VRRIVGAAAALLLSVGLSTSFALPASAANGGPGSVVSCSGGSSCQVSLQELITVTGDNSPGSNGYVTIPPPPCLWIDKGNAITGSQYIIGQYGHNPAKAPQVFQIPDAVKKADDLLKKPKPGEWYFLQVNPQASAAGQAYCQTLPVFYWGAPNTYPPINIPPSILTDYAESGLTRPDVTSITVNPVKISNVNLPTYVTATIALPLQGTTRIYHNGLYIAATAYVPGQPSVTVWATSSALRISGGALPQEEHNYSSCHARMVHVAGRTAVAMGTQATPDQMSQVGVGATIDCGVTYLAPSSPTYSLAASLVWKTCWAVTGNAQAPPATPPACQHALPQGLRPSSKSKQITVQEIQSSNGG
jgi:hypothetical protein